MGEGTQHAEAAAEHHVAVGCGEVGVEMAASKPVALRAGHGHNGCRVSVRNLWRDAWFDRLTTTGLNGLSTNGLRGLAAEGFGGLTESVRRRSVAGIVSVEDPVAFAVEDFLVTQVPDSSLLVKSSIISLVISPVWCS
jgi:hypothetical protein